jgi:hypothetical protein
VVIDAANDSNERASSTIVRAQLHAVIGDARIGSGIATSTGRRAGVRLRVVTTTDPAAKRRYPCNCGARTCRGTILAKKR